MTKEAAKFRGFLFFFVRSISKLFISKTNNATGSSAAERDSATFVYSMY